MFTELSRKIPTGGSRNRKIVTNKLTVNNEKKPLKFCSLLLCGNIFNLPKHYIIKIITTTEAGTP